MATETTAGLIQPQGIGSASTRWTNGHTVGNGYGAMGAAFSPAYNGTTNANPSVLAGYNPKVYSPKLLRKFYANCVVANISNTDYLGEIVKYGDKVIVRKTPDVQIRSYSGPGSEVQYDIYSSDAVSFTINKGATWGFVVEDVDVAQTDLKNFVSAWTDDAAKQLDIYVDTEVLSGLIGKADASNKGNAAGKISQSYKLGTQANPLYFAKEGTEGAADAMQVIADAESCMSEQNLPTDTEAGNFWWVGDERFFNLLATGPLAKADLTGLAKAQMLNGGVHSVPNIGCFTFYKSNLLPTAEVAGKVSTTDTNVDVSYMFFGHKMALAFAAQLTKNEVLRNPRGFGDLHRGLLIYGYDVIYPIALGEVVCVYKAIPSGWAANS